jgi:hypothetical protein
LGTNSCAPLSASVSPEIELISPSAQTCEIYLTLSVSI